MAYRGSTTGEDVNYLDVIGRYESDSAILVPHGDLILTAEYVRKLDDLILVRDDDAQVVLKDFFRYNGEGHLQTEAGARVSFDLAEVLAGPLAPGQYAQAAPSLVVRPIGSIENLQGIVSSQRVDGTKVNLGLGDPVYQGDTIQTSGSGSVGILFEDNTSISLSESGRMVLDDFVYDPETQVGSSSTSVVQGVFSFVSGQIAKNGPDAMVVNTPVATIGIRGTTVAGRAAQTGQENTIALLQDSDGGVGQITVANAAGSQILSSIGQSVTLSSFTQAPPAPVVLPAAAISQQFGAAVSARPVQRTQEEQRVREETVSRPAEEAVPTDAPLEEVPDEEGELGPDGEPVPEGEVGPDGEPVPEGELGPDGEPVPEGELGPDGEPVQEGELGPDGEPVPEGELGPDGEPVLEGEAGPDGEPVLEGEAGPDGEPVPEGEVGPDGEPVPEGELAPDAVAGAEGEIGPDGASEPEGGPGPTDGLGPDGTPGAGGETGPGDPDDPFGSGDPDDPFGPGDPNDSFDPDNPQVGDAGQGPEGGPTEDQLALANDVFNQAVAGGADPATAADIAANAAGINPTQAQFLSNDSGDPFGQGGPEDPFGSGGPDDPFGPGGSGDPFGPGGSGDPFGPGGSGGPFGPGDPFGNAGPIGPGGPFSGVAAPGGPISKTSGAENGLANIFGGPSIVLFHPFGFDKGGVSYIPDDGFFDNGNDFSDFGFVNFGIEIASFGKTDGLFVEAFDPFLNPFFDPVFGSFGRDDLFGENIRIGGVQPIEFLIQQAAGGDVFLQGNFIELGINNSGTMGSISAAPDNFHETVSGGDTIGFVVDLDGFDTGLSTEAVLTGDFILPGDAEDSFTLGVTISGTTFVASNALANADRFDLAVTTSDKSAGTLRETQTTGAELKGVDFEQVISFDERDTFFTTKITLTNNNNFTTGEVRFLRSFDPDQDGESNNPSATPFTENDSVNPANASDVSLSQAIGIRNNIAVNLVSLDGSARGSNFGTTNRNPFEDKVFDNPLDAGGGSGGTADKAMTLTLSFGNMTAGQKITKSFVTAFQADNMNGTSTDSNDFITLTGTSRNVWDSGSGNDTVLSYGTDDDITLGSGDDTAIVVSESGGSNVYTGGSGSDTLTYSNAGGRIKIVVQNDGSAAITNLSGNTRSDTSTGVERFIGSKVNDTLTGGSGNEDFTGNTGQDTITSGGGADTFRFITTTDGEVVTVNRSDHSSHTGDIWADFTSSTDNILLFNGVGGVFGSLDSSITDSVNFETLADGYNGTNAVSSNFANGKATLIHDTVNDILFFDDNGSTDGFTVLAELTDSASIAASDFSFTNVA